MRSFSTHQSSSARALSPRLAATAVALSLLAVGAVGVGSSAAATKAAAPVLTALKPASGHAGQSISLVGTGFHSNNGVIFATFGAWGTRTRCPSRQLCVVLVPSGLKGSQMVRLHTQSGVSNALTFRYTK